MKAIVLSLDEFLVNTFDGNGHISGEIVLINRKETQSTSTFNGGENHNVPIFSFLEESEWEQASNKIPPIDLEFNEELKNLYSKVHNAIEDQFQTEADFYFDHADEYYGFQR